jgi:hypothetical protein
MAATPHVGAPAAVAAKSTPAFLFHMPKFVFQMLAFHGSKTLLIAP